VRPVEIRFLGSGDAFSSGGRFQACLYLSGAEEPLLLDCGATSLTALKRARIDPATIGWVALSHLHGDHFAGVPWLIIDGQFAGRTRPLVIAGPPGTRRRLDDLAEALYPGATSAERDFDVTVLELTERATSELGPASVTPFKVRHGSGAPAYALRVQYGGKVIAYSGDTEWTDGLIDAANGADLFICECNSFDKCIPGHIDYRTLAENRARLQCKRIVLTHMSEEMLANLGDVKPEVAHDGSAFTLDVPALADDSTPPVPGRPTS
jgi:ribonuclease BN (tRNA processing enzyme)